MADKIQLPNGALFPVKEGESKEQALAVAKQMYPNAFAAPVAAAPKGGSGLGDLARAFGSGAVGATGALASVFGADNAAAQGLSEAGKYLQEGLSDKRKAELQMQAERMKKAEESGSTWQEVKAGLLNVLEAPLQTTASALGSFVPVLATLPLAKLGLGARAVMAVRGAIGGAQGAGAVKQSVYEAVLRAETEEGKSPEQAQAAAVRAQNYVGENLDQILLGTGLGYVAGSTGAERLLPGGVRAQAGAAQQALAKRIGERAATGVTAAAAEMPLEGTQGAQERVAANLALQRTGRDVDTFTGAAGQFTQEALAGGLGGGALGAAFPDRSLSLAAAQERKDKQAAAKEAAEQERVVAEQEEARKNTPEYALEVGQQYDTLLQEFQAKQAQLKNPGKNADPVQKAEYADAQKEVQALNGQLKELVPEYRRTAPIRAQIPPTFELTPSPAETAAPTETSEVDPTQLLERKRQAQQLLEQNQQELSDVTAAGNLSQFDAGMKQRKALQKEIGQIDAQLKQAGVEDVQTDPAAIQAQLEKEYVKLTNMAGAGFDPDKAERQRTKITKLETQLQSVAGGQQSLDLGDPLTLELPLTAAQKQREALAARGTAAGQERIAGVEAEEQAALDAQRAQTERDIQAAQREQSLGGEFAGLQRMKAAPAGISDQFGLFGTEQPAPAGSAGIGQMQQKLMGEDVTYTAEEEKPRDLRRVPGAEFKLRGRNEGAAPVTREELADRLNRVLSTYDLSPEAVDLLQRAEKALPQSGADYFALLDEQLAQIESGAEGVPRKGQSRTTDLQTFRPAPDQQARASATAPTEAGERQVKQITGAVPGEAASGLKTPIEQPEAESRRTGVRGAADVTKRVADTTPSTLRGPSARAGDLSLARELEEPLLRQEEAARDDGRQKALFPEEQEKLGNIKTNRGLFQIFMKSKFVQNLRQQLRRDEEIAKRVQAIPALEKRANGLIAEIEDILQQYAEYRSAAAVVKANKDVAKAKRDMAEIRSAATKSTVDRMVLAGAIEDLKQARKQVIEQGYNEGGVQELIADIDAVNAQLQDAQTDMALLNSALSVLDGQMQSFAAVQKMTALLDKAPSVERIDQAKQEFAAVRAELDVLQKENNELQTRLRKDVADKRRAEEAVKDAERKAQVAAGRIKPSESVLNNLPNYDKATQYPALTEAQLLAREQGGTTPTLSAAETTQINGDPAQVLGGYRSRITDLEKLIKQSQDKSKAALAKDMVQPTQNLRDALDKAYKKAKSTAERDVLGPKLDAAEAKLAQAKAELANTQVIWIGMKKQINDLANVMARADWLEGLIAEGKIELEAPATAKVRAKPTAEQTAATRAAEAKAAAERTNAPSTSGEALTRSEAVKARQPQKTLFEGKGKPGGAAVEIGGPTTFEKMQARARERLAQDLLRSADQATLKYIPVYYKGALPTDDTAEAAAAIAVQRQIGRDRRAIPFSEKIRDALAKAIAETKSDLEVFSGNPEYREYVAEDTQLLAELRKMRVEDFSDTEPKVAPRVPVKTLLAKKAVIAPAQKLVRNTAEDYTSDQVAKNLGTTFVKDAPFHGMTFAEAARYGAKRTTSPQVRVMFEKLAEVFDAAPVQEGSGRVYAIDRLLKGNAAGIYNSRHDVVYTRAPVTAGMSANKILLHELTHAATVRGMQLRPELASQMESLRQQTVDWLATPEGRTYFRNHKMGLAKTPAGIYGLTNHKEFVAELFANREFQKLLAEIPSSKPRKSIFTRFVETLAQFFNMPGKAAQSLFAEAVALTEDVLNVTKNEVYGGAAPSGGFANDITPYKVTAPADALEALSKKIIAQPQTLKEKLGNNLALQTEMQAVDMRAGLRETLRFGDDSLFTQAMYHVRKAEQKMAQMFTVMNSGPLVAYKDEKGLVGYRSSNQNSAREVFDAIADVPIDDPQLKTDLTQAYLVAVRANNKGLPKLDLGAMKLEQAELDAALAAADANPALKSALENVRRKYSAYNKGMIEFLASTGRISKKEAADLLKEGDYVPFYRVDKNGNADLVFNNNVTFNVGDIRRQPYLAELKGGETKLLPLNEAIQRNTLLLTDMALTNNAAKSVAYGLQALGKGAGPVDPKTGKPSNLMAIKKGFGTDDAKVVRFYQEPDPNDPKDDGKRHIVVDTKGTLAEGIPAELVVQSLEGASLALPGFLKLGGAAADLLRAGVTRTPLYIARKLVREPMAAAFTGGLNTNAFSAVFKAGAEFLRMSTGSSDMQAKLIEKGLIQSNIFAGDMSDMKKMALQIASGKDQGALEKVFAAADRYAMRADAATLALVLKNAEANGLSEVEADMMTMESMNFYKRGLSPTLQYAARLIPFFNAQIQGLNVLVKAARGNMPFEEQQQIKRKFYNNALLLTATGLVYAMAMEDDETFRNARPRDKYSNFFLPIPGVDEPLKLPIPFEAGYFFSLAVAAVDSMRAETDGKAQWQAVKDLFLGSIPGYSSMGIPQIAKPALEVWTNKNFLTGGNVESLRLRGLDTEERYLATTTELAKQMSKAVPVLSPIQIEHIVRGYLGVLPLAAAAGANSLFEREGKGEKPEGRASDLPLIGGAFQKKYGGADADVVFREAQEAMEARTTFNKMVSEGRREDALEYRDKNRAELAMATAAGQYRQVIGRINADIRRTQERNDLTPAEKRLRLDALDKAKQDRADAFLKARQRVEEAQR
jgi:hypothetical protein